MATLDAPAESLARRLSLSVPAFFVAARAAPAPGLPDAASAGSTLTTSARMLVMLERIPSTNAFRAFTSASESPNCARFACTMPIVSSRSCRSHSIERRPESSSDVVHLYSSLPFPVADLRISFHRLCSSSTTLNECWTSLSREPARRRGGWRRGPRTVG